MQEIDVTEAAKQLKSLFAAALNGEKILITEMDAAVELVPVRPHRRSRRFGSARGAFEIADDFDQPLTDFDEYRP
jgi:antitoxin (DNA-binding transcriptional repressor) of toxin-antitoxin stability system